MRIALAAINIVVCSSSAFAVCGERGGPAFRKADGKCAGWAELDRACGSPPTTRCSFEGGGIGATGVEKGKQFIAAIVPGAAVAATAAPAAASFGSRTLRSEGNRLHQPGRRRKGGLVRARCRAAVLQRGCRQVRRDGRVRQAQRRNTGEDRGWFALLRLGSVHGCGSGEAPVGSTRIAARLRVRLVVRGKR